jgi:hypothetical protein
VVSPSSKRENSDSQLSDSESAALEYAKQSYDQAQHRKWLWGIVGKGVKWIAAVIGFFMLVADAARSLWKAFHG